MSEIVENINVSYLKVHHSCSNHFIWTLESSAKVAWVLPM